jgi:hypothetical protein
MESKMAKLLVGWKAAQWVHLKAGSKASKKVAWTAARLAAY